MNNILFFNICLLAVTAMVCSARTGSEEGDSPRAHVTETERRAHANVWSRITTITRQRREAEKKHGSVVDFFNACCNAEKPADMEAFKEKMGAVLKECMDADKSGDDKGKFWRAGECAAKKRNLIDDAGNLQIDGIRAAFKESPLTEHQKSVVDNAINTCYAKTKDESDQTNENNKQRPLHRFNRCVRREFLNACPKDKQDTSERCEKIRAGKGKGNESGDSSEGGQQ